MLRNSVYFIVLLCLATATASGQNPSDILKKVNSGYDEQHIALSPDRQTLFFTVANHPSNVGGKKDPGDIWISLWNGSQWDAPVHGGTIINNSGFNAVAGVSEDGLQIFLMNHYNKSGNPTTQGIAVSKKMPGGGWSYPENISISYFLNRSTHISGMITPDGNILVLSLESYGTRGAEDIYVSFKNNESWSEPKNVGSVINTSLQELSPSLSDDTKTLYFATNARKGFGSFDIYSASRLDDSWTAWSEPENVRAVNTDGRELFYHYYLNEKFSIYTTTRNSDGYGDIRISYDSGRVEPSPKIASVRDSVVANQIRLTGYVTDMKTNEPLPARLQFKSDKVYTAPCNDRGLYSIVLPSHEVYSIEITAPGHVSKLERADIRTFDLSSLEINYRLQPIEVGAMVNLKSVLFETGTTKLLPESFDELNVVVEFLTSNPRVEIELEGHTDNRGDARKNLLLSQLRVAQVKNYLVSKGIAGRRIKGKGYGGQRPVATEDSEEARKLNRRVEFVIVKAN